jgi:very-short-patch-repair endonuclease
MSPIEAKLYEATCQEGLNPIPQFCVQGCYVDFAFPDIQMAVEADGAAYHDDIHKVRDRKRDWILRNAGWTVKRFHGTTIHQKAEDCAYVVRREVKARRDHLIELTRREEMRRLARRDAILRPFRWIARLLKRPPP